MAVLKIKFSINTGILAKKGRSFFGVIWRLPLWARVCDFALYIGQISLLYSRKISFFFKKIAFNLTISKLRTLYFCTGTTEGRFTFLHYLHINEC